MDGLLWELGTKGIRAESVTTEKEHGEGRVSAKVGLSQVLLKVPGRAKCSEGSPQGQGTEEKFSLVRPSPDLCGFLTCLPAETRHICVE